MAGSKTTDRICCLLMAVMVLTTCFVWLGKAAAGRQKTVTVGYECLFDQTTVHEIALEVSDWESFLESATREKYVECSVSVDGEKISNVGVRAKGNTSLSSVSSLGSEKYSFKIEFDHFVKGRSYRGLDKLSLNNLIYDATMMKDYLAYTLMGRMDVPSPLCSYGRVTVNGELWGLYLLVEGVEESFLERNNMTTGEMYKPDSMSFGGGRGNGRDFDFDRFRVTDDENADENRGENREAWTPGQMNGLPDRMPEAPAPMENAGAPEGMNPAQGFSFPDMARNGGMFRFGDGNSDVKLQYIDDDPDSYSNIFDNAKTGANGKAKKRLVEALKTLSGDDPQEAVFTDEVIRYLAVHDFLQNDDSYTGMMVHNYYLYEEKGRLAIIPWDYNLAFGGMGGGNDGTSLVNSPIDSPVSDGDASDRPLVAWILNGDATEEYHAIYSQFISDTIESGWLKEEITRVSQMIRESVADDPNGFYSLEEFEAATNELQLYCALRGESIRGQLSGTIPSTSQGQSEDRSTLVDGSQLSVSTMGAMNMGGGNMPFQNMRFGQSEGWPNVPEFGDIQNSQNSTDNSNRENISDAGFMPPGASGGFPGMPDKMPFGENAWTDARPDDRSADSSQDRPSSEAPFPFGNQIPDGRPGGMIPDPQMEGNAAAGSDDQDSIIGNSDSTNRKNSVNSFDIPNAGNPQEERPAPEGQSGGPWMDGFQTGPQGDGWELSAESRGMSPLELGIYAGAILLAMLLAMRIPGKER
ncbi:MAG: CotH kinase family protein [Clostridia bacterium]|nr:CotH kinase family protein [Clostridia bacterium]